MIGWIEGCFGDDLQILEEAARNHHLSAIARSYLGVGYDVTRGVATMKNTLQDLETEEDPMGHKGSQVDVHRVQTLRMLHEARAIEAHLNFLPGMFALDDTLHLLLPREGDKQKPLFFWSVRRDEYFSVKLRSVARPIPELASAIAKLPEAFLSDDYLVYWQPFFAFWSTHWIDSAFVGGSISMSTSCSNPLLHESSAVRLKQALDGYLRTGSVMPDLTSKCQHILHTRGGMTRLIKPTSIDSTTAARDLKAWLDSIQSKPAVVRFGINSMAQLVLDNVNRRRAMIAAIEFHLGRVYGIWREKHLRHDEDLKMLSEVQGALTGELSELEAKMKKVQEGITSRKALFEKCSREQESLQRQFDQCLSEKKSFQQAVIRCDKKCYPHEAFEKKLMECQAKKKATGCV